MCIRRLCLIFYTDTIRRGPLWNIVDICKEYGIREAVRSAIESGVYMSKVMWKRLIKEKIRNLEKKRWTMNCKLYKTLSFMYGNNIKMSVWWMHAFYDHSFAKQNRVIIRLLLNVNMYQEKLCQCCGQHAINNVTHILFVCQCNMDQRVVLWEEVKKNSPAGLIASLETMSVVEKTKFILNACKAPYIREWKLMYDVLSNYIFHLYQVYNCVNDEIVIDSWMHE